MIVFPIAVRKDAKSAAHSDHHVAKFCSSRQLCVYSRVEISMSAIRKTEGRRRSRVAGRGCPRPAPSEPCMGLSIHTAQASAKASYDTRLHNCICGVIMSPMAIEMVHLKIACSVRPALRFFHNVANAPRRALCDRFLTGNTHAILPPPHTV